MISTKYKIIYKKRYNENNYNDTDTHESLSLVQLSYKSNSGIKFVSIRKRHNRYIVLREVSRSPYYSIRSASEKWLLSSLLRKSKSELGLYRTACLNREMIRANSITIYQISDKDFK